MSSEYDDESELESLHRSGGSVETLVFDSLHADDSNLTEIERLKSLSRQEIVPLEDRYYLLKKLYLLICDWQGQLPNLREIFRNEQIDRFLRDAINYIYHGRKDEGALIVGFVACSGYKDEPDLDEDGRPVLRRTTAIHRAVSRWYPRLEAAVVRDLFEIYEANYVDRESGNTHFLVACSYGLDDVVEKFLDFAHYPACPNEQWKRSIDLALRWAVSSGQIRVAELLLRRGADPNLRVNGRTPLHFIVGECRRDDDSVETFFENCKVCDRPVLVDARNGSGDTPLMLALQSGKKKAVESLLRHGADPNLAHRGSTPMHIACERTNTDLAELFFEVCQEIGRPLQLHLRDKSGNAPLHLALSRGCSASLLASLLRAGADPNQADAEGYTPLQFCLTREVDELLLRFFEINDEMGQAVRVDARNRWGRTPLQWAVANLKPRAVDLLLDHGADLYRFVFPDEDYFAKKVRPVRHESSLDFKLRLACDALAVLECLERRGYELDRSDATTIMKFFAEYGLIEESADSDRPSRYVDRNWYKDEEFVRRAKEIAMNPSLSLYDLIRSRPEKAKKLIAYTDYREFARSGDLCKLHWKYREACAVRLCEIMSRGFFRRWALDPLMETTNYRLPVVCCDLVMDKLANEDLYNICIAAEGRGSKWGFSSRMAVFFGLLIVLLMTFCIYVGHDSNK
uniref:Uncharacterized protein n=1 Tax=Trichogramma kaykai TaxID=54128 RepID=A0ABD2WGA4_9HYME